MLSTGNWKELAPGRGIVLGSILGACLSAWLAGGLCQWQEEHLMVQQSIICAVREVLCVAGQCTCLFTAQVIHYLYSKEWLKEMVRWGKKGEKWSFLHSAARLSFHDGMRSPRAVEHSCASLYWLEPVRVVWASCKNCPWLALAGDPIPAVYNCEAGTSPEMDGCENRSWGLYLSFYV